MGSDTQMEDTSGPSAIDVSDAYAKRKVGRPITSERTLARNFPEIDEIRGKLLTGECFGRMRTSGNSSSVWQLFEEIAYSDSQLFTGIVRCKACAFMTRYHGQITGTSHMRRHHCFREAFPEAFTNSPKITPNVTINKIKKEPKVSVNRSPYAIHPVSSSLIKETNGGQTPTAKVQPNTNRIATIKSELRERILQFCYNELITVESMTSDTFKSLVQSLVKLCTTVGKGTVALPDRNQLYAQMTGQHNQCKNRIKEELNSALQKNIGGALVCDSEADLCVISTYYINSNWQLVESILSATAAGNDINAFISQTLEDFELSDDQKLSKFTFISRGGLFDGVSMCLTSMAHVIDGVIESAVFGDDTYTEIVENCKVICAELRLNVEGFTTEWVVKFEIMRQVIENRHKFELKNSSLDLDLVKFLVDFLAPFKAASVELRQCSRHPTLNHVLLWYYKLLKHLNATADDDTLASGLKTVIKVGMEQNFQLQSFHKIAAFLWPNFRFLKMLSTEEREEVHNEVRELIDSRIVEEDGSGGGVDSNGLKKAANFDEWEEQDSEQDELNKYISVQLTTCNEQNILIWWREHQQDFPKLSHLAKWILSIPASVTSLERFKLISSQEVTPELLFMHCNAPFKRSLVMDKSVKTSWQKKMQIKNDKKIVKLYEQEIKDAKQQEIEAKRVRREANKQRKQENARKAEITVSIKNPKKLKRIAKKQMKQMRKVRRN
ncbi:unnamed protein product [Medioppia subpectinata]|uniref:BED-type domain-containing protein n=1 Tax=Medioppia subpectinata TaxID=1979941 RepID=A0A7R9KNY9_9ACAR|nr:unnamed protein product [Medioppia subpectinata]CAG2105941.1 unnamed protein product [Medioppia subpectinata]